MGDSNQSRNLLAGFVSSYVEALLRRKVGLENVAPGLSDVCTGCVVPRHTKQVADRFKLTISYAGQQLTWEVLFNFNSPSEPPDFIFPPDDDDFCPEVEHVKTLCNWDANNHNSLIDVVNELLRMFKQYHLSLLNGTLLEYEYNSLMDGSAAGCHTDDVEVYLTRSNGFRKGPVHFLIRLTVMLNGLPDYVVKENFDRAVALLQVTYQTVDGGKVIPRLLLSSHLEQILSTCGVRLNTVPFPHEGCLVDYVLSVRRYLQNVIENVKVSYEKRKDLISSFLTVFDSCVLEFDTQEFSHISFLFIWNDFSFIASVKLSTKYPNEQPLLTLQSIYHVQRSNNLPYFRTYSSYPYSPRWSGNEFAQRTRAFIIEIIQEFQKYSVYEGSFCMA